MDDTLTTTVVMTGFFFVINLFLVYILLRYRHREGRRAAYEPENRQLERWLIGITTVGIAALLAGGACTWAFLGVQLLAWQALYAPRVMPAGNPAANNIVLSTLPCLVAYFRFVGYLRWSLILTFMLMKAGLIVAVFMHMDWERLALVCAILLPPLCMLVLVALMVAEADHTFVTRLLFFR